jgi:hypothetical protein
MRPHVWKEGEIFVFGSNLDGIHGAGAALFARLHCGAQLGVGEGLTGQSYALPTCKIPGVPLSLREIEMAVNRFLTLAVTDYTNLTFFVTRVACGFAGYTDAEIAPLFRDAPINCTLPPEWDWLV